MKIITIMQLCCISIAFGERNDRMFSLFNVVKFKNTACQSASTAALTGICHTSEECSDIGGTADGNCAASFGVCCVVRLNTCASTVTQNGTFVENPGFATAYALTANCVYTINKCNTDICQVRLDFTQQVMAQPAVATGLCNVDSLAVAPNGVGAGGAQPGTAAPPLICGTNTGHHMYIDAGATNVVGTLTFAVTAAGTSTWRVQVTQHECFSPNRAPNGCLQYFSGSARYTVTSFNFDGNACTGGGCFLQAQDYRVCFRRELGSCGLQYTESPLANGDAFQITNGANFLPAVGNAAISFANCANAFLQIANIVPDVPATQDTFCGGSLSTVNAAPFPSAITSTDNSFRVAAIAGAQNTLPGFSLDVTQVPCPIPST